VQRANRDVEVLVERERNGLDRVNPSRVIELDSEISNDDRWTMRQAKEANEKLRQCVGAVERAAETSR
jgi:hypothetical protein